MKDKIRNMSRWNKFVIIIFVAIFILGCFIFKDYGVSTDELVQGQHSLVNLYYIILRPYLKVIFCKWT